MPADRKRDRPARTVDLVGELDARRRGPDDHDSALFELSGAAVLRRRDRGDARWHLVRELGNPRDVAMARRHHDGAALPVTLIGRDDVAGVGPLHRGHGRVGLHWRADGVGIALDERDDVGHRHVPVGVVALVAIVRQAALPVGSEERQRVPTLGLPCVRDAATLEHDVVDAPRCEASTHREPSVAGADDDGGGGARRAQTTSTVTFVGFVMMS